MIKIFEIIKKYYIYVLVFMLFLITSIVSATIAFKIQTYHSPLQSYFFVANNSRLSISLPFLIEPDAKFSIDPEIRFYVQDSKAFYGNNNELSVQIYSVAFKTHLLRQNWEPNLQNMAQVSINTLKKNISIKDLAYQTNYLVINNKNAIEITATYMYQKEMHVQRVIHFSLPDAIWSIKATFKENTGNNTNDMVTKVFNSILIEQTK